jgi:parallel beta-helix repeat protein
MTRAAWWKFWSKGHGILHRQAGAQGRAASWRRPRPGLEALEDRSVPAVIAVGPGGSIQAAVNAANPGDTISVAPGTYTEQITIPTTKDGLKLVAAGSQASTIIQAPATLTANAPGNSAALIEISGAQNVMIKGFTITGQNESGVDADIRLDSVGSKTASATIRGNHITGLFTGQADEAGFGIRVGQALASTKATAKILNNTIDNYQKGGIIVDGTGSDGIINNNTVTGPSVTGVVAQNGIQISNGADGFVVYNTVSGNDFSGPTTATGIVLFNTTQKVVLGQNTVSSNDVGISLFSGVQNAVIAQNNVLNSRGDGIDLFSSSNNILALNQTDNSGGDGIYLQDSSNNLLSINEASDNAFNGIHLVGGQSNILDLGFTHHNQSNGILLEQSNSNTLVFNATTNNIQDGISLVGSNNNNIQFNVSAGNGGAGIRIDSASTGNTIQNNITYNNGEGNYVLGVGGTSNTWAQNNSQTPFSACTLADDVS